MNNSVSARAGMVATGLWLTLGSYAVYVANTAEYREFSDVFEVLCGGKADPQQCIARHFELTQISIPWSSIALQIVFGLVVIWGGIAAFRWIKGQKQEV